MNILGEGDGRKDHAFIYAGRDRNTGKGLFWDQSTGTVEGGGTAEPFDYWDDYMNNNDVVVFRVP